MLCPPLSPDPVVVDWVARHRTPWTLVLHIVGIPPTILGVLYIPIYGTLLSIQTFLLALVFFVGGFGLQFLGHALDRTEPGEITFFRKWIACMLARRRAARGRAA